MASYVEYRFSRPARAPGFNDTRYVRQSFLPYCLGIVRAWQESVTIFDGETTVLKNLPAQDQDDTVHECVAPSANLVISADNDPCFEGGIVVPTDEVPAVSGMPRT